MELALELCEGYQLRMVDYARKGLRVGIWASSGRGKSFGVGVFCEELLRAGIPIVAIDPEGELYTLRERYRILVLGGERGDLPLTDKRHAIQATLTHVLNESLGLVIDLSDKATNKSQQEAARAWLEELWVLISERRSLAALVVEEVHIFAPQSGSACTADMMQRFAKQGRKRGAILVTASQRTQAVSKEFMSQLNFSAVGGFETERDYEAVKAVLDGHSFDEFRYLEPGRFYLSAVGGFYRWRSRLTSHGGESPAWEAPEPQLEGVRDSALDALVEQLRAVFEDDAEELEEKASDPAALEKARIRELEQELGMMRRELAEAQAEVNRLTIALQVASTIKVIVQQEVVAKAASLPVPAVAQALVQPSPPAGPPPAATTPAPSGVTVVKSEAKPADTVSLAKDVRIDPNQLLALEEVKTMIRKARERARRRSSRSTEYMHLAVRHLVQGATLTPTDLAARYGYYGKVTVNRMEAVLDGLVGVGFATFRNGAYRLNEPYLKQVIMNALP